MARNSKALAIVFLVMIFLIETSVYTEARHLRCKKCSKRHHEKNSFNTKKAGTIGGTPGVETSKVEHVEDFRPTTPGHSPGIGHSIHD